MRTWIVKDVRNADDWTLRVEIEHLPDQHYTERKTFVFYVHTNIMTIMDLLKLTNKKCAYAFVPTTFWLTDDQDDTGIWTKQVDGSLVFIGE